MKKKFLIFTLVVVFIAIGLFLYAQYRKSLILSKDVRVAFFDIGQGDAAYVEFPGGSDMLVDCGKDRRVLAALGKQMGFFDRAIDYLVVTHPDMDHYGGCVDVLKRYNVKNIIYNGGRKTYDAFWRTFWETVQAELANYFEIDKEQSFEINGAVLHFLYPDKPVSQISGDVDTNNKSIVFSLSFGKLKILFTGDAEKELEEYLMQKYGNALDSDLLKVGHHGSPRSSSEQFLRTVTPAYAIISVGKENTYGHPSLRVIKRLERVGAQVWRTDIEHTGVFQLDYEKILQIK